MRKPIIAGNWKMFKTRDEALAFIYAVNESLPSIDDCLLYTSDAADE